MVDAKSPHFSQVYDRPMYVFPYLPTSLLDENEVKMRDSQSRLSSRRRLNTVAPSLMFRLGMVSSFFLVRALPSDSGDPLPAAKD